MNMDEEISHYIRCVLCDVRKRTYKTRWLNHIGVCYKEKENKKMNIMKIIIKKKGLSFFSKMKDKGLIIYDWKFVRKFSHQ